MRAVLKALETSLIVSLEAPQRTRGAKESHQLKPGLGSAYIVTIRRTSSWINRITTAATNNKWTKPTRSTTKPRTQNTNNTSRGVHNMCASPLMNSPITPSGRKVCAPASIAILWRLSARNCSIACAGVSFVRQHPESACIVLILNRIPLVRT